MLAREYARARSSSEGPSRSLHPAAARDPARVPRGRSGAPVRRRGPRTRLEGASRSRARHRLRHARRVHRGRPARRVRHVATGPLRDQHRAPRPLPLSSVPSALRPPDAQGHRAIGAARLHAGEDRDTRRGRVCRLRRLPARPAEGRAHDRRGRRAARSSTAGPRVPGDGRCARNDAAGREPGRPCPACIRRPRRCRRAAGPGGRPATHTSASTPPEQARAARPRTVHAPVP
jgi:hypothetical protein